jgi:hypothetical protein
MQEYSRQIRGGDGKRANWREPSFQFGFVTLLYLLCLLPISTALATGESNKILIARHFNLRTPQVIQEFNRWWDENTEMRKEKPVKVCRAGRLFALAALHSRTTSG